MINITTRISFSKKTKRILRKYWKSKQGILNSNSWSEISKIVRNEISKKLFYNQGYYCVYCERYLLGLSPSIDHFAHKAKFSRFVFNPINVFYSCTFCNSSVIKGQKPTISKEHNYYHLSQFQIVHPYLNNPEFEIKYRDKDRIYIDISKCSELGRRTVSFFEYDELMMTNIRAQNHELNKINSKLDVNEKELIMKSISYK